MPFTMILSGWLHKTCRFNLLHSLPERYFILTDKELRHYKHPDDFHPACVIHLQNCRVERHGTIQHHHKTFYGIRLVVPNTQLPIMYAETKQERRHWIDKIQFVIDRLAAFRENCCRLPTHELTMTPSKRDSDGQSVLDKWLDRLDLVCKDVTPVVSPSSTTPVSLDNRSLESLFQVGYFSESVQEQQRHNNEAPPRQHSDETNATVCPRPIKSLLKQREIYANRSCSNDEEVFDSRLVIPLSPRPSSCFILK